MDENRIHSDCTAKREKKAVEVPGLFFGWMPARDRGDVLRPRWQAPQTVGLIWKCSGENDVAFNR
jgi:hypothetical protein